MLDAACPGQVFTSPTPNQMIAAAKAVGSEAGVLFIVKNYAGDVMNFQMAMDMMDTEFASVLVNDDVVDFERRAARRGRNAGGREDGWRGRRARRRPGRLQAPG